MRHRRGLVAVALLVHLHAGALLRAQDDRLVALQKAEGTWARSKPTVYQFTVEVRCFCGVARHPVSFRVSDGRSESLDSLDNPTRRAYEYYDTIDKLFGALRRVATTSPFKMAVTYDPILGYPVQADLDPRADMIDDELFLRVTAFKVLSDFR
jgi:uncharacterized protein DUF6174